MLQKLDAPGDGRLQYTAKYVPISVSLCSNVPRHTSPICIVDTDLDKLLQSMFNEMDEIQETVSELSKNKWGWIKKELVEQIQRWCQEGGDNLNDDEFMDIDDDEEEMGIDQSMPTATK